jgi:hypothetical protein
VTLERPGREDGVAQPKKETGKRQPAAREPVKRPTQTRRRTEVRRKELINAAARLFASRSYYAVTVDDIGEALGLSGPALYVEQRENMAVWRQEFHHLPEADSRRLRRAQRLYVEEWVHTVHELRPELNDASVRALVHGVFGLLQSPSDFQSGLDDEGVKNLLMSMAVAAVFQGSTEPLDFRDLTARSRSKVRTA